MAYQHITFPARGARITYTDGHLLVPDEPYIGFVEGDGIGPDIMRASLRVWDAAVEKAYAGRRRIRWVELLLGEKAAARYEGDAFPAETLQAMRELVVAIKGPLTTPVGGGFRSLNVALRQELDLYACVRPVRYYAGVPSPLKSPELVDVVIFRENTEDLYTGIEYRSGSPEMRKLERFLKEELGARFFDDSGLGVKPISPFCTRRLVRKAIQYALDHGRESVTLVHKGNIMKYTEGAFRNWGYALAHEEFGDRTLTEEELFSRYQGRQPAGTVVIKDRIADIMFQLMQLRPGEFDVIATPNLNGDYLSDAVAAEVGGVGIAPGANIGDGVAVFEATHGTAPKYANLDKVNPGSLLLSGVMMLEYLGWNEAADLIVAAYPRVVSNGIVTYDFARQMQGATEVSTSAFADALIAELGSGSVRPSPGERARRAAIAAERLARSERRMSAPVEEMIASGRTPHTVSEIMNRRLVSISAAETVDQAMHQMHLQGVGSILVTPGSDGEWGIMTQTDVVRRIVGQNRSPQRTRVGDVASRPLRTVPAHTTLAECASSMMQWGVRRVVVMHEAVPVGIVSDTDVFRTVEAFGWGPEDES